MIGKVHDGYKQYIYTFHYGTYSETNLHNLELITNILLNRKKWDMDTSVNHLQSRWVKG